MNRRGLWRSRASVAAGAFAAARRALGATRPRDGAAPRLKARQRRRVARDAARGDRRAAAVGRLRADGPLRLQDTRRSAWRNVAVRQSNRFVYVASVGPRPPLTGPAPSCGGSSGASCSTRDAAATVGSAPRPLADESYGRGWLQELRVDARRARAREQLRRRLRVQPEEEEGAVGEVDGREQALQPRAAPLRGARGALRRGHSPGGRGRGSCATTPETLLDLHEPPVGHRRRRGARLRRAAARTSRDGATFAVSATARAASASSVASSWRGHARPSACAPAPHARDRALVARSVELTATPPAATRARRPPRTPPAGAAWICDDL